jgi:RNA polymerase sigma-70 factor (ECF subfamily)
MSTAPDLPEPLAPPAPYLRPIAPGDSPIAFDEALRAAAPRLRRYAARRLGDLHEAEEVVQETLLRACQHQAGFATEDDLMAWSTVVSGRLVIDRLRLRSRSVVVPEIPESARTGRDTADVVVARDEARAALDALEAMPARQAAVLWAREVEGLSYDDIAERFDLSEPTVRSLLHRARRTLRREYAARGGTLPAVGILVAIAPWRDGLHYVDKLRAVAKQSLAPAATSLAALSVIGAAAVFVMPGGGTGTQRIPAVAISPTHTAAAATTTTGVTATPSHGGAPKLAASAAGGASGGGTGPTHHDVGDLIGKAAPHRCVRNQGSRADTQTGINCAAPDPTAPVFVVRVPVPKNPVISREVGISSDRVDCRKLPDSTISRCVQGSQTPPARTP